MLTRGNIIAIGFCLAMLVADFIPDAATAADPPATHVVAYGWTATDFHDQANPGCSIARDGSVPGGRLIMGASRRQPDPMNLVIRKSSWLIPPGTLVQVQASFPDGSTIRFDGRGTGQKIEIDIATDQLRVWVHELTASATMQVVFGGNEPPWTFDLSGTTNVVNAMGDCFRDHQISGVAPPFDKIMIAAGEGTQPFSTAQPTQPFGTAPAAPSQPFGEALPPSQTAATTSAPVGVIPVLAKPAPRAAEPLDRRGPPNDELGLVAAVEAARAQYQSAGNDMAKGAARYARAQAICRVVKSPAITNWIGKISELTTNGDGKGIIAIEIAPDVLISTWNNALSDISDHTLIDPASAVFRTASGLSVGQPVRFSAELIPAATDCFNESSLTMNGSITAPKFIMRLIAIQPLAP